MQTFFFVCLTVCLFPLPSVAADRPNILLASSDERRIDGDWAEEAKPNAENQSLSLLMQTLDETDDPAIRTALMRGMLSGLAGRRNIAPPAQWNALSLKLAESDDAVIRDLSQQLSQLFGDEKAMARALATVKDRSATARSRRSSLHALLTQRNEDASDILEIFT